MDSARPLSFKRASARQTLYPYPDSPALGELDRRSMSTTGGVLPRRENYRSGVLSLLPQKTGEQLYKTRDEEWSGDERDPAQIEAAYLNLVGGGGPTSRNMSSEFEFGTPGEKDGMMNGQALSPEDSKKRTDYFDEQFNHKDNRYSKVRERIEKDSPVVAELRTNVIVKDEFTLVTDMSYNLSQRYSRPEASIMINLEHSACLLLAGSFEPAYILTITALPSQLQPVTNKRNSALIQSFMADVLSVPPERGILRFQPIPEENMATNGTTIYGEIERIERSNNERNTNNNNEPEISAASAIKRAWTKSSRKSVHAKKPTVKNTDDMPTTPSQAHAPSYIHSRQPSGNQSQSALSLTSHPGPAYVTNLASPLQTPTVQENPYNNLDSPLNSSHGKNRDRPRYQERRKSTLNGILKNVTNSPRNGSNSPRPVIRDTGSILKPPPIPSNSSPSPKVSKRKSIVAMFKR